jgi:hypothetical protein
VDRSTPLEELPLADGEAFDLDFEGDLISDEDLAALALGANPDAPLASDAVPLVMPPSGLGGLLPSWYMPIAIKRSTNRWWRTIAIVLVLSFLVIEAAGLCSTYGSLVVP